MQSSYPTLRSFFGFTCSCFRRASLVLIDRTVDLAACLMHSEGSGVRVMASRLRCPQSSDLAVGGAWDEGPVLVSRRLFSALWEFFLSLPFHLPISPSLSPSFHIKKQPSNWLAFLLPQIPMEAAFGLPPSPSVIAHGSLAHPRAPAAALATAALLETHEKVKGARISSHMLHFVCIRIFSPFFFMSDLSSSSWMSSLLLIVPPWTLLRTQNVCTYFPRIHWMFCAEYSWTSSLVQVHPLTWVRVLVVRRPSSSCSLSSLLPWCATAYHILWPCLSCFHLCVSVFLSALFSLVLSRTVIIAHFGEKEKNVRERGREGEDRKG